MTNILPTTTFRWRLTWTALAAMLLTSSIFAPVLAQQAPQQEVVPLAPSDMTSAEYATYQSLANDPQAQMSFRDTRAFLHLCQRVEAGKLRALDLPMEPKNYDDKYLSTGERKTVEVVLRLQTDALVNAIKISN